MNQSHKYFESERLIIHPTSVLDAEFVFELMNTPKWIAFIGDRKINMVADAKKYIEVKMLPQLERLGFGNYTVIRKSDKTKVGTCGLYDREGLDGVDIGFAFLPQFENLGYAFESVNRLKDAAINDFNLKEINAITLEKNIGSQKLLEKIGMRFEKMIRIPNDPEELMFFTLKIE
jgi:RimJ/RimL family protein N-acetyltransferase